MDEQTLQRWGDRWSPQEDATLCQLWVRYAGYGPFRRAEMIGREMHRTRGGVMSRAAYLDLYQTASVRGARRERQCRDKGKET